ncbi:MAG: response regulator [Bacteroidales bacterium]|jgi:CheY-like chemotaxis protein|nr:response regulator [Bacteroidales bacterium]
MKILVVDDILVNRLLLKEILKKFAGVVIKEAENGKEAIKKLQNDDFDIIFMDIEMSEMNGLDATKYIRNQMPEPKCNTTIIAITAHNPNSFAHMFAKVGFNDLMVKPYSIDKIQKMIDRYK